MSKKVIYLIGLFFLTTACASLKKQQELEEINIEINPLLEDSSLSVRAIEVNHNKGFVFSGNKNKIGFYTQKKMDVIELTDKNDTMEYRGVYPLNDGLITISAGSPAKIYRVNGTQQELVYTEKGETVFYDSMKFWNEKEGIAFGDTVGECMSVLITRDGGSSWKKVLCEDFVLAKEKEGAFAASNTNIKIHKNKVWLASGTRIFHSKDKGKTWSVYSTPIIQGEGPQGIYSVDFYNEKLGAAIGGDYTKPDANEDNFILTFDGGKTWIAQNGVNNPGYRSCIQFIPKGKGKQMLAVGFKGIDLTLDGGKTWKHLSDESYYSVRFIDETSGYLAGRGKIAYFKLSAQ